MYVFLFLLLTQSDLVHAIMFESSTCILNTFVNKQNPKLQGQLFL